MHLKTLLPWSWLAGGLAGIALSFSAFVFFNVPRSSEVALGTNPVSSNSDVSIQYFQVGPALLVKNVIALAGEQNNPGLPLRLRIPAISVDTSVVYVGLTSDGAMDITNSPEDVAWFNLGPRPGQEGSAVIAGHSGIWKGGISAVFDNLYKLRQGDKIYVENEKGTTTFVVRESRNYDPQADASSVFASNDGGSHLNLITCEGAWDPVSQSYSQRLVVFTDRE